MDERAGAACLVVLGCRARHRPWLPNNVRGGMGSSPCCTTPAGFQRAPATMSMLFFAANVMATVDAGGPPDIVGIEPQVIDDLIHSARRGHAGRLARASSGSPSLRARQAPTWHVDAFKRAILKDQFYRQIRPPQRPHGGQDHAGRVSPKI